MIEKVSIQAKAKQVTHHYEPKEIAVINDMSVKLAKFEGPFTWHKHDDSDELFLVINGELTIEIEGQSPVHAKENELIIIPKGVKHRPNPDKEVLVALLEPTDLLNTGDVTNEFTVKNIEKI